jgi:hypothetical protein
MRAMCQHHRCMSGHNRKYPGHHSRTSCHDMKLIPECGGRDGTQLDATLVFFGNGNWLRAGTYDSHHPGLRLLRRSGAHQTIFEYQNPLNNRVSRRSVW